MAYCIICRSILLKQQSIWKYQLIYDIWNEIIMYMGICKYIQCANRFVTVVQLNFAFYRVDCTSFL